MSVIVITYSEPKILQRGEAVQVLREIIKICSDDSPCISSVSLDHSTEDNGLMGYQLRIGTSVDSSCRNALMTLLKRRNLEMEEKDGYIVIFKSH